MPKTEKEARVPLRPLGDRILVRVDAGQKVTPGGIHLPDQAQERPHRGTVLAVGEGKFHPELVELDQGSETEPYYPRGVRPLAVKPGDRVLYSAWAGVEVPKEIGEDLRVLREDDLLGVEEAT